MSKVPLRPIQRSAFSGSTRNCQTVSGLAAISSSRSITSRSAVVSMVLLLLSFGFAFKGLEPLVPELVEECLQVGEPFRAHAVEAPGAVASFAHEPGLLQDGQVLGDRGPRNLE